MQPEEIGKKYDRIAEWWHEQHEFSNYGVELFNKALSFHRGPKSALDVGCGS